MATFPTSPPASRHFANNSTTPTKPRIFRNGEDIGPSVVGGFEGSPTSTLSAASTGTAPSPAEAPLHQTFASSTSARPAFTSTEPPRQIYVRSDPALLTCFDPADRELYDLWAPKR